MASVISGEGLGLYNSSLNLLGGASGNARLGQHGDAVYVNNQTGNLILQQQDEFITSLGLDFSLASTYSSLGKFDEMKNKNKLVRDSLPLSLVLNSDHDQINTKVLEE